MFVTVEAEVDIEPYEWLPKVSTEELLTELRARQIFEGPRAYAIAVLKERGYA